MWRTVLNHAGAGKGCVYAEMAEGEEEDYLSMTFDAPTTANVKETSLQRTARLKQEAAERGRVLSKRDAAEKERAARELALATQLDASNKGAKMMAKMGFKGGALGKSDDARTEPIEVLLKEGRGGIGMDSEKKRKIREAAAEVEGLKKRQKVDENEYRERTRSEREERRAEGQMWSAMRTLEGFETGAHAKDESKDGVVEGEVEDGATDDTNATLKEEGLKNKPNKPLRSINILWRPLVKQRLEKERERRMRYDMDQSLSRKADYDDPDADEDDKLAFGTEVEEFDDDDEYVEQLEFDALPAAERLERIVHELREKYQYCFWCKYRYPDASMDGCPGLTEDEHG